MPIHEFQSPDDAHLPPGHRPTSPITAEPAPLARPRTDARMILGLQRTAGNAAVADALAGSATARLHAGAPAWVQRAPGDEESDEEQASQEEESEQEESEGEAEAAAPAPMGIGEQKRYDREMQNTHSPRLREKLAGGGGVGPMRGQRGGGGQPGPYYREPKERGIWNGKTRPAYYPATWTVILGGLASQGADKNKQWQCPKCNLWLRKWSMKKPSVNGITIDHKESFEKYVRGHARANDEGKITNRAAQEAYNDLKNLVGMCRDCNSKKNGEKNVFD